MYDGMVAFTFLAIWFGIFGYLMSNELSERGEVFGWLPKLFFKDYVMQGNGIGLKYALAKITWLCSKCIAGFWCFWSIFVTEFINLQCFCLGLLKIFTIAFMCAIIAAFVANVLTKLLIE